MAVTEEAGAQPYALLFNAMRESGYAALAEFAMRRRQRAVVIRPGETGILRYAIEVHRRPRGLGRAAPGRAGGEGGAGTGHHGRGSEHHHDAGFASAIVICTWRLGNPLDEPMRAR